MRKALVDYVIDKMGGVEAIQKQYESELPVTMEMELPSDLADKIKAEAASKETTAGAIVQGALLEYFTVPRAGCGAEDSDPVTISKVKVAFKLRPCGRPTRVEMDQQDAVVFMFLSRQDGKSFYSHAVAEQIPEYESKDVSRALRRLFKRGKIKKSGRNRGTRYFVK